MGEVRNANKILDETEVKKALLDDNIKNCCDDLDWINVT